MPASDLITLTDSQSGARARIAPALGYNCFAFQGMLDDRPVDLLWSEEGFELGGARASGSGIPLLFPFPGRIPGTTFHWQGRQFQLEPGDGRGNAIHGFVHERPWRVLEQTATMAVGQFHAATDAPELLEHWPADFRITATYEIGPNQLRCQYVMDNPGDQPLPCGFGTHPYFRVPLDGPDAAPCIIRLPVSTSWKLVDMIPTGEEQPLDHPQQYQAGQAFQDLQLDTVFGGLLFDKQQVSRAVIEDPHQATRMTMSFDQTFRECVVYTPPHRQAICIEPLTCVPDPFRLDRAGVNAGLRLLEPGESFTSGILLSLDPADS